VTSKEEFKLDLNLKASKGRVSKIIETLGQTRDGALRMVGLQGKYENIGRQPSQAWGLLQ
jgi:hypothetical protein